MDERRGDPPDPETGRPPIAAAASQLSRQQKAWKRYVDHSLRECLTCRTADGNPCPTAEALYGAYQREAGAAFDQLGRQS